MATDLPTVFDVRLARAAPPRRALAKVMDVCEGAVGAGLHREMRVELDRTVRLIFAVEAPGR